MASGCGLVRILEQCKGLQELSLESCEVTCAVFKANPGLMEAIKGESMCISTNHSFVLVDLDKKHST